MNISIHDVTRIELSRSYLEHGNSRTIRIVTGSGETLHIRMFGDTDAAEVLPKADDFRRYTDEVEAA